MNITIIAAVAGWVALLLVDLLNLGHPELDPVAHMASYFVHGNAGWLLVVAVMCWAVGTLALLPRLRQQRTATVLVGLFGAGLAIAAIVPTQPVGNWDAPVSTATWVHAVAGWMAFVVLPVGAWLVNRRWRDQPLARTRAALPAAAIVLLVLMVIGVAEVMDGPDHLGHVLGLLERLMLAAEIGWVAAASVAAGSRPAGTGAMPTPSTALVGSVTEPHEGDGG